MARGRITETVEVRGHIIDSLILPKILDEIVGAGADYEFLQFDVGKHHNEPSYARIQMWTENLEQLETALSRIHQYGAVPTDTGEATLEEVDRDGAFPSDFYSTTNLPTEVRVGGKWLDVQPQEMDCGIVVEDGTAQTIAVADVRKGQMVVTGRAGVRVTPVERPRGHRDFEFMSSSVSSEKPKELLVQRVVTEMKRVKEEGKKILWVVGPALIHTGSGPDFAELVENGWVNVLFAGNGFATHDIESNLFKTSLGIFLEDATSAEGGTEHHIRAINEVRRAGSIAAAIDKGIITEGVMYNLVKNKVPYVLAASVRDDGPLPDTVTDMLEAQRQMRALVDGVGLTIIVATMLHGIATGNLLPAAVPIVCVDINPSTVTKLLDRGSSQSAAIVTDVGLFVKQLNDSLS
ncbi:MAG TPA: TIGR00300 family protein [Actinomycetota bacterium]|nr:TIGR00300 family protein [Actinomycetota bacterium]